MHAETQAGVIEQVGAPLDLYNNPRNRFVAGFIGSPKMNFLEATVQGSDAAGAKLRAGGSEIVVNRKVTSGDKVTFGYSRGGDDNEAELTLGGRVG